MIDEILSQIEAKVGEEILPKIQGDLKKIAKAHRDLEAEKTQAEESIKETESESIGRKKKIQKLEKELAEKDGEIKELKESKGGEDEKLKAEFEKLKAEKQELETFKANTEAAFKKQFEQQKEKFLSEFGKVTSHKNFEKTKANFKLPEPDKKTGEYDFSNLSDDDIKHNAAKLEEYTALGMFAVDGNKTMPHNDMNSAKQDGDVDWSKVNTPDDIRKVVAGAAQQYN